MAAACWCELNALSMVRYQVVLVCQGRGLGSVELDDMVLLLGLM